MPKTNYTDVLLEEMNGKFEFMMEAILTIQDELKKKADKSDVEILRQDIQLAHVAINETNKEVLENRRRIKKLEQIRA